MATKTRNAVNGNGNGHEYPQDPNVNAVAERLGKGESQLLAITPPRLQNVTLTIRGTVPLVMNRFGQKSINMIMETQQGGSVSKKGKKREPKDFNKCYEDAKHVSTDGWIGIPAPAFRNASVAACRLCGFKMTHAKLGIFVVANGVDVVDGTPLVKITKGEPRQITHPVRNSSGVVDIRARPMWDAGWEAEVTVRYDADMFTANDVVNLLSRVGSQVGLLEGRPDSKASCGVGWGLFDIVPDNISIDAA